jgi:hypothetical protein
MAVSNTQAYYGPLLLSVTNPLACYGADFITVVHSNGRLLALPADIDLGPKRMAGANTQNYYGTPL